MGASRSSVRPGIRKHLFRNLFILVLFMAGLVFAVTTIGARKSVKDLADNAIVMTEQRTDSLLYSFFGPIEHNLHILKTWGLDEVFKELETPDALNRRFAPFLTEYPQVTSMLIANEQGDELLLLWDGNEWKNRVTRVEKWGNKTQWWRWSKDFELLEQWEKTVDYDPRTRPWYQGAVQHLGAETPHWTDPYTFFTSKDPGITASTAFSAGEGKGLRVVAFDVLLMDVSSFTQGLDVGETGVAFVSTLDGRMMGFPRDPRYPDRETIKSEVLKPLSDLDLPHLQAAVERWKGLDKPAGPFVFHDSYWWDPLQMLGGGTWRAGFKPFTLGKDRAFQIGVVVPEREFRGVANQQRNLILIITILGLFLAGLMALFLDRLVSRRLAREIARIRQLGQYTLEEKLGEGGMGEVYRASHAMLRRPTAIKLMRSDSTTTEEDLRRFEQEVQATSHLTHPNTIAIYDYGRTENNVFYYAMEYIGGVTLYDLVVKHGPVPPARVIHILRQVCGSIHEAHCQGFIHRDIKPANIMLCKRGAEYDVAKVLDFGLVTEPTPKEGEIELPDEIHGTPGYIPPETIEPPHIVEARGDLYTIGAVGYFMLTGTHVFDGRTAEILCAQHVGLDPTPPSERLGKPLPDDLSKVILDCLEKEPKDRPKSARVLSEMLAECADGEAWSSAAAERWWTDGSKGKKPHPVPKTVPVTNQTVWVTNHQGSGGN